jgi:WhiB family redox-sensing transcriptional regulator
MSKIDYQVVMWSEFPLPDWHRDAECAKYYTPFPKGFRDVWFPERYDKHADDTARRICAHCPVRELCLLDAIENEDVHGTRGGMTAAERRKLLRTDWAS